MLQEPKQVTILYLHPFLEFRQVRINEPHRAPVEPSWYGDSVGHYEGDTLVIDTVGQKVGPYSMVDPYGTPFTAALHVVERYRLVDYKEAKEGLDSDAKWNSRFARVNPNNYLGKYLQLSLVIEDEEVFTTPWTATITYWRDPPTSAEAMRRGGTNIYVLKARMNTTAPTPMRIILTSEPLRALRRA